MRALAWKVVGIHINLNAFAQQEVSYGIKPLNEDALIHIA